MKRIFFFVVLFAAISLHAEVLTGNCGAEGTDGDNLQWSLDIDNRTMVITGSGAMADYGGYSNLAPWYDKSDYAWYITLPDGLTYIGKYAFSRLGAKEVVIPNTVTEIGNYAFYQASVKTIHLSENLTTIGECAFIYTQLDSVYIPASVVTLYTHPFRRMTAFADTYKMEKMVVDPANTKFDSRDNCNAIIETANDELIVGCQGTTIPSSVKVLGNSAFCSQIWMDSIVIPEGVTKIDQYCFYSCCRLCYVVIPKTVTTIAEYAFWNLANYAEEDAEKDIYVDWDTPLVIEDNVFENVDLSKFTLHVPCGTTASYEAADVWKDFGEIVEDATYTLTLGVNDSEKGRATIEEQNCNTFVIKAQRTGHNIFTHWSDGATDAERTVTLTGDSTITAYFEAVQLSCEDVHDSISVEAVGSYTWNGKTYKNSGDYEQVFLLPSGCDSIVKMHLVIMPGGNCGAEGVDGDNLKWSFNPETGLLRITGSGVMADYSYMTNPANYAPWYDYRSHITSLSLPDGMTQIGNTAFYNLVEIAEVIIPSSVTSIQERAFSGCDKLRSVVLPPNITTLETEVFCGCSMMGNVTIPAGVVDIKDEAMENLHQMTECIIPHGVKTIGRYAFYNNWSTTKIVLPSSVESIGVFSFAYYNQLADVYAYWDTPLAVETSIFASSSISTATLHVPCGSKALYEAAEVWSGFGTIVEDLVPYTVTLETNNAEWGKAEIIEQTCTTVTVLATRIGRGTQFVQWSDGITEAERTLIVTSDTTLTAIFEKVDCEDKTGEFTMETINSYTWNGITYDASGNYQQTLETTLGCDSVVTLHLTINPGGNCGAEGTDGNNLKWMYRTATGELIITGSGAMKSFYPNAPWYTYREGITSISLPAGMTTITSRVFAKLENIEEIDIPASVTEIESGAFGYCSNLKRATLPPSLSVVPHTLFFMCRKLEHVVLPERIDTIEMQAFSYCDSLKQDIVLPDMVKFIGEYAFGMSNIKSITIPASVDTIGNAAFMSCSLKDVYVSWKSESELPRMGIDIFCDEFVDYMNVYNFTLHVPCGTTALYDNIDIWKMHFKSIEEPPAEQTEFSITTDGPYIWNGTTYDADGDYQQTFTMTNGCDSIVTLHLTIIAGPEPEYEMAYVCDFTKQVSTTNQLYNSTWTYDTDWTVYGGSTNRAGWTYCKFGGKQKTLADANPVYLGNVAPFAKDIRRVKVYVHAGSLSGGMSVNEWGVDAYSANDYAETNRLGIVPGSTISNVSDTITIDISEANSTWWAAGNYLRVYWNLTNTTTSNGIIWIDKVEFYSIKDTPTALENTMPDAKAVKILRNGQLLIIRDGKIYNAQGLKVR